VKRLARLAAGIAALLGVWLVAVWPPPVWFRTHWPAKTAFMEIRDTRTPLYRPVPLESITPALAQAVIVGEDQNFWDHGGIDFQAIRQALGYSRPDFAWTSREDWREFLRLVPRILTRRGPLRGASTITQQLAKNLYLSPSRNPLRKVKEAVTAYRLEAALGKTRSWVTASGESRQRARSTLPGRPGLSPGSRRRRSAAPSRFRCDPTPGSDRPGCGGARN
jgi:monofunctional biosynthetic peptidoglycan transglycosylase